ncbi:hypothetical protein [Bacteroides thetaiotaomicron]|uniref:hypothetical protein n=1 Tax=Bacteroides thetaiotaomicron TaxID=818 RepID=UPI002165898B|nr:hypothetical protein [Bacteroides thetaiotaomicron]MCS3196874.1 hypothetical protein [Bacteroides thetaiotaomicron]
MIAYKATCLARYISKKVAMATQVRLLLYTVSPLHNGSDFYKGQMKMAMSLIPYMSTITGWPLKKESFY